MYPKLVEGELKYSTGKITARNYPQAYLISTGTRALWRIALWRIGGSSGWKIEKKPLTIWQGNTNLKWETKHWPDNYGYKNSRIFLLSDAFHLNKLYVFNSTWMWDQWKRFHFANKASNVMHNLNSYAYFA